MNLTPIRLERRKAPEILDATEARQLRNVETGGEAAAFRRAGGQSRVSFTSGVTSNVLRAFAGSRRDGKKLHVGYTEGGTLFLFAAPTSAYEDSDYE